MVYMDTIFVELTSMVLAKDIFTMHHDYIDIAEISKMLYIYITVKTKTVVLTHLGSFQLQLQLSGLHYHGMCAPLQCVINPYPVNYLR